MIKNIIIPDVHGRKFWKDAVNRFPKDKFPDMNIIFLGDYLDPYTGYEDITKEDAFVNFEDILEYAKNDFRVTLLIGNHDWHYFVNLDTCRIDYARVRQIEQMFKDNMSLFKLYKVIEINNTKYLFTHAGITQKWLNDISIMAAQEYNEWNSGDPSSPDYIDPAVDEDYKWIGQVAHINETYNFSLFDKCLEKYDNNFYSCLPSMVSRERGGWYPHGSLIWADVHEHLYDEGLKGYYQIFGHTITYPNGQMSYSIFENGKSWAMLDASQAFVMDIEGNIKSINKLNK